MPLSDVGSWLINQQGFREKLDRVIVDAVCGELGTSFVRSSTNPKIHHDWGYLLFAASVLAQPKDGESQGAALRIAQACLCDRSTTDSRRDAAALILDALSNHPSLDLAVKRDLIRTGFEERIPFPARLEWLRRLYEHSIARSDGSTLRVNRFQRRLWQELEKHQWVSVSAPTSAGKSFILGRWICDFLHAQPSTTIVYIVPTRALISQVECDLRTLFVAENLTDVTVSSLPLIRKTQKTSTNVFVFTQERLHILLTAVNNLPLDALIVDEAHKVGDRQRGVLLQHVIERVTANNAHVRVVFASPMTENPEVLLSDGRKGVDKFSFKSEDVTVNQNLLWISQRVGKPKIWDISLCLPSKIVPLGEVDLPDVPSPESKRLPFVAYAIGKLRPGNIIYVNGAADAEKVASQLYDLLGPSADIRSKHEIKDIIELVNKVVHKKFLLGIVLRRGVAFHYGNLPLLIRQEIEHLFSVGIIRYLVCTSTLIEGVNMACRNIFLRGPQKGRGKPISAEDFWNLAGRAGRWGKEFQGNIFCVDAARKKIWGSSGPPRERGRYPIRRTTDNVIAEPEALISFIKADAPINIAQQSPELESVFSYLAALHVRYGDLLKAPWATRFPASKLRDLSTVVRAVVDTIQVPKYLIERNPGICPLAMDSLLNYFRNREGPIEELLPADPASDDAPESYVRIFIHLAERACPKLGPTPNRSYMLALLVTRWMRGFPLSRLISERITYLSKKVLHIKPAEIIRNVMTDVEQIARFEAPRGLGCYCDVLSFYLKEKNRDDLIKQLPDLSVLLEFGVSQKTQVSLIGLGLSRTSTILISELITKDSLNETKSLEWLRENIKIWRDSNLPALVKKEVERVLSQHTATPTA